MKSLPERSQRAKVNSGLNRAGSCSEAFKSALENPSKCVAQSQIRDGSQVLAVVRKR